MECILEALFPSFPCLCNQMPRRNQQTKVLPRDFLNVLHQRFDELSDYEKLLIDFSEHRVKFYLENFLYFRLDTI